MRLQDIMSTPVATIVATASVAEARETMKREGIHHLVIGGGRNLAGVVSSRDLIGARSTGPVGDLVTDAVATATPRTTVREAANLLRGRTIGCLPVVDGGRVVGIVTISDLLELIGKGVERPTARAERASLTKRGPRKARPTADRQRSQYSR
jgi:acetoin utilization protein AcuB